MAWVNSDFPTVNFTRRDGLPETPVGEAEWSCLDLLKYTEIHVVLKYFLSISLMVTLHIHTYIYIYIYIHIYID